YAGRPPRGRDLICEAVSSAAKRPLARLLALVTELAHVPIGRIGDWEQVADPLRGLGALVLARLLAVALTTGAREGRPLDLAVAVPGAEPVGLLVLRLSPRLAVRRHDLR